MPLVWSREEFHQESQRLVSALQTLREEDEEPSSLFLLSGWYYTKAEGYLYLTHPPILRHDVKDNHDLDLGEEEEPFWDDTIFQDDTSTSPSSTVNNSITTTTTTTTTQWYFDIVYSDTWRVPLLYFRVENRNHNGSPCSRSHVVTMLRQYSHYNRVADAWEFLSHEEHPITGIPSFFLHPCQTMQRMETLTTTSTSTTNGSKDDTTCTRTTDNQGLLLLSWMTMILPSVGYSIPSKVFQKLLVQLQDTSYSTLLASECMK
jgi:Autophagocytosis associated protein, active-site domain